MLVLVGVQPRRDGGKLPRETRLGIAGALIVALALIYPLTIETRSRVEGTVRWSKEKLTQATASP